MQFNEHEESKTMLLKSVSAPPPSTYSKSRGKGFVRPNCSTTFWLQCPVCCKRYFKYDSHFECFQKWCEICQDVLPSPQALQQHALTYHKKNYCQECNHVFENIRGHRTYEHAGIQTEENEDGNDDTATANNQNKKQNRMIRSKTTTTGDKK